MKHLYNRVSVIIIVLFFAAIKGNAQTWQSTIPIVSGSAAYLQDVTTDASDNIYSTGYYNTNITAPVSMSGGAADNTFLIRANSTGAVTFSKKISGASVKSYRVAVDGSGNMYIAGSLYGTSILFDGFVAGTSLGGPTTTNPDGFIAKYSSTGTFMWVQVIGAANRNDEILDMALDANGDIYVTGYISADASVYGKNSGGTQATTATIFSQGGSPGLLDVVVAKFSSSGVFQWGFSLGSTTGAEKGTALAIDASNNVFVAGQLFDTADFDPLAASSSSILTEVTPQGSGDAFIAKYTSAGDYVNVGQISGASIEMVNRMHIGSSGALNVAGTFTGFIDADPRSGNTQNLTSGGTGKDILFASYNLSTLAPVFAQKIGASNVDDEATAIKATASGDIYLTGYFEGATVNFNPGGTALNLTATGGKDIFISKYTSAGINQWAFGVGSAADDRGTAMAFNSVAMVYAGGYYSGAIGDFDPGVGSSTLAAPTGTNSFWSKYQECSSTPVIATQPSGQTICAGATINLSATVTGSSISYQWKKGGTNVVNGGTISGATTSALTITSSVASDAGTYTLVATICGNSATTNNAVVVVNTPPVITTQPTAQSVCSGTNTSFAVTVTGTLPTYQWKLNGTPISNNAIYSGAQAATLNIIGATAAQAGNYSCDITGSCTPVATSNAVALTISSGVTITTNPTAAATCLGGNVTFTTAASGSSLTYQWQKNGVNMSNGGTVSGATSTALSITGVVAGDATNYKCVITSSCGSATTTAAILSLTSAPAITTQPVATQTICAGQSATFSVTASGATTHQWKKGGVDLVNGGNISGATTSSLLLTSITTADAGTYTCSITGACSPAALTNNAVLTVNSLPAITAQPTASTLCQGATANFNITATGSSLTFQWQRNGVNVVDGGGISGATTNALTITSIAMANAGNYTCIVSGTCSPAITSNAVALTVNSTAAITSNPVVATTCAGQTATFSITTSGSGITYQWKKGGTDLTNVGNISGALSPVLTLANTVASDAGLYSCTITNTCSGVLNSTSAALTVNALPAITTQPTDVTICGSAPATFTVGGSGTGISYQWKKGGANVVDGGVISGATTSVLSINPATVADAGAYTCVISGTCTPSVTTNIANLAVGSLATITTQPADVSACAGSTATLSIIVSGTGISYQWQKGGTNLTNGGNVSGATSATLTLTSTTSADAASYTCVTGNTCSGFLTSNAATITINTVPVITAQPVNKSICTGTPTSFSVTATGTSLTYLWKKDGVALADGGAISGSQTATVSLSTTTASDAGTYICEVSGTCTPKAISTGATLTLASSSSIVSQPVSKTACTGSSIVFTCNATGGSLTYQWRKDGTVLTDGGNISGATTFTLTLSSIALVDAGDYTCDISSTCSATLTSNIATLTINNSTVITSQPASSTQCTGTSVSFDVVASGAGLTYQWMKGSAPVSGATNSTYTIASIVSTDAGTYTCDITASCGFISSAAAILTVNSPVAITTQPVDISACPGDNATISLVASGSVVSYQWFKNSVALVDGGNISNSTTSALTVSSVSASDADSYTCQITTVCGSSVTSSTSVLSLSTTPTITTQPPASALICTGQSLTLNIVVSSASTVIYQWQKNGVDLVNNGSTISGATSATLTITSTTAADAGNYTCSVATSCSTPTTSQTAVVSTTTSSSITQQPISANVCKTQSVLYTVSIAGSGIVYKWQFKANAASIYTDLVDGGKFSGVTTKNLVVSNVDLSEEGAYRCVVTEACGAVQNSAPAALMIDSPSIIQHPFPQSVCLGQPIQFSIVATGSNIVYQWYKDGVAVTNGGRVSGAATATLKITGTTIADNGDYTCNVTGICPPVAISQPATLTVSVCTAISVADLNGQNVAIYPKPANDRTTLEIKDYNTGEVSFVLYDAQGALVLNSTFQLNSDSEKITIDTSTLPQGMYFIQIYLGNEFYVDKIEVIH
ncbi:immunoglobulin domain-containing protein [Cytophaga aurantiaca]|uniref:immunoglobulin domain-containing protein n=1 Tax=Cytophaga aurantiaca TaxID=29530 RepID=UPI00037AAF0B|nr:immunoglobulin domain-containing protein [Cytophaga aurantiaca]